MKTYLPFWAAALLAACQTGALDAPTRADLAGDLVRLDSAGPPEGPEGACWASDTTPAIIETVTEQIIAVPEQRGPDGTVITAAQFRTDTRQRMVQDREVVWFQSPCPAALTVDFIATLQRALKARGLYLRPLTGVLDAPTRAAIRQFQEPRGLDSETLSLGAARELGIVATERDQL